MSFKFSPSTIDLLKNFASVNNNIYFKAGDKISTITDTKNFLATGTILEDIPVNFGIYDLSEFLNVMELFGDPILDFSENHLTVRDEKNNTKIKYFYSAPEILTTAEKMPNPPEADLTFTLSEGMLHQLNRASKTLALDFLSITKDGDELKLSVIDVANATSNSYSTSIPGKTNLNDFNFIIKLSDVRIMPGDYNVTISKKFLAEFNNIEQDLKYFLALERSSTVNG